jgi:hypothetical protein
LAIKLAADKPENPAPMMEIDFDFKIEFEDRDYNIDGKD